MKSARQLNIKLLQQDIDILEAYSEKTQRTKTDILREFIRSLQSKLL
ncbi:CopG family transcriptional regulator [Chamaesiphon polymorphus CCALA 037]|uniref:CopG family transcriptional regulator n=1 Tax=Chamaesiphon polymorphus CCALA 037 TaxID=2107692 RepID=A0A2T1GGE9_9CYAN|nr:CopG family transcriptional regulator [Chamaesiphon polymorphus CCALA 037]